jgi:alginate O-acetyltransferase complex protein AlgJ
MLRKIIDTISKVFTDFKNIVILIFMIIVSTPIFLLISYGVTVKGDIMPKSVKVNISKLPEWKWAVSNENNYPQYFDEWYNREFPLKDLYLEINKIISRCLWSSAVNKKVILGKAGWMYLNDENVVEQYRNIYPFTTAQLDMLIDSMKKRGAYLKRRGIEFVIVICPNKKSVYPEYLPDWCYKVDNGRSFTDAFVKMAQQNNLDVVDLRPVLNQAKALYGDYLYYTTDTHWSDLGAYVAYREIIGHINDQYSFQLKPVYMDNYQVKRDRKGHDLATYAKVDGLVDDYLLKMKYGHDHYRMTMCDDEGKCRPFGLDEEINLTKNMRVINENSANLQKALIFHDSFSLGISKLYNRTFDEIQWMHWVNADSCEMTKAVEKFKPDVVIYQVVERYIVSICPTHTNWKN